MGSVPESEGLNGKAASSEYPSPETNGVRTYRWRAIRKWLRAAALYTGRAGSAPSDKTCTDVGSGELTAISEEAATRGLSKVRGYCCDNQARACFLYSSNGETGAVWCKGRNGWTPTPCIANQTRCYRYS